MKRSPQSRSDLLWHAALGVSLLVTIFLLGMTAWAWSRSEFVETTLVPKDAHLRPQGAFLSDEVEWIEVPVRPLRALLTAEFSPLSVCLLVLLVVAVVGSRSRRWARRAAILMCLLYLDRIILLAFLVRISLSRWEH